MSKRRNQRKAAKRAAPKLPAHLQRVAFTKFSPAKEKQRKLRGTYGAAGPCKRICPASGHVIETISKGPNAQG